MMKKSGKDEVEVFQSHENQIFQERARAFSEVDVEKQAVSQIQRVSNQIKGKLYYFGLIPPQEERKISERYLKELEEKGDFSEELRFCLGILIKQWLLKNQVFLPFYQRNTGRQANEQSAFARNAIP